MLENVRDKLRTIYDSINGKVNVILDIFIQQFGDSNVDSDIMSFEEFIEFISHKTLGYFGITEFKDSNEYGSYELDREDYEINGRGKSIVEYAPDLGVFDYLVPEFRQLITRGVSCYSILIHFPKVRISNEYDKFVDVQDLYAKIIVNRAGILSEKFFLTRTTFPYSHYEAQYAHSHLPGVYKDDIGNFKHPCLGDGPIYDTQETLRRDYNEQIWGLFAYELSKYVTIESISGGPYIRLESIGKGDMAGEYCNFCSTVLDNCLNKSVMDKFARYYAEEGCFKVKFVNNEYQLGESTIDACVHLSNKFIEWYNIGGYGYSSFLSLKELLRRGILGKYIVANNTIYSTHVDDGFSVRDALSINGRELFKFKGETVTLKITDITDDMTNDTNVSLLLSKKYCEYIITKSLSIINYKYGKRNGERRQGAAQVQAGKKPCIL